MKKTHIKQLMVIIPLLFGMLLAPLMSLSAFAEEVTYDYTINLTDRTFLDLRVDNGGSTGAAIQVYTKDQYAAFLEERMGITGDSSIVTVALGVAPIYITEFLYDGVGMVVSPDLDDAIAAGESYTPSVLDIPVLNIGLTGNILISGNYTGMIAINANDLAGDVNLYFQNVNINTDNKKAPAIYVYNKDITYTDHKVTIRTVANTANTVKGGKLKKVSLVGSDQLESYADKYTGTAATNYAAYPSYYGIYTAEQIEKVLFAKVEADSEDLQDGDPYYFYKAAGAISSDIDLYFEGEGLLEVTSLNKEGVESKGNLTFSGGTGNYHILAMDDALNTTTNSTRTPGAHNTLFIDVDSLSAVVDPSADEGDAIDSNGALVIGGGTIYAIAHPTSGDDGLDSETGTVINGGTVVATGNMSDPVSTSSSQAFLKLSQDTPIAANTPIVIKDSDGNNIAGFMTDRTYKVLTFSSPALTAGATYSVYTGGVLDGTEAPNSPDGTSLYTGITSYTGGTLLATVTANANPNGNQPGPGGNNPPTPPAGENNNPPTPPSGENNNSNNNNQTPPENNSNNNNNSNDNNASNNNNSTNNNTNNSGTTNNSGSTNIVYAEDTDDVAIPNTSAYTVTYPSTGLLTTSKSSVKSAPSFVWAVSGCSATALVLYAFFERRKHAVRFQK